MLHMVADPMYLHFPLEIFGRKWRLEQDFVREVSVLSHIKYHVLGGFFLFNFGFLFGFGLN